MKSRNFDSENPHDGRFETGLIDHEIYYDCPELKHLVFVPPGATPSETKQCLMTQQLTPITVVGARKHPL